MRPASLPSSSIRTRRGAGSERPAPDRARGESAGLREAVRVAEEAVVRRSPAAVGLAAARTGLAPLGARDNRPGRRYLAAAGDAALRRGSSTARLGRAAALRRGV